MANVSFGSGVAYSTDTIQALLGFYKINKGWGYDLLFTLSTQVSCTYHAIKRLS